MFRSRIIVCATGALFLVAGCQTTPSVSIEEAKKITASFEGQSFKAPPRTIRDITKILEQFPPQRPDHVKALQQRAAEPIPADVKADKGKLAHFLYGRAMALDRLGKNLEAVNVMREAISLAEKNLSGPELGEIIHKAAWLEMGLGRWQATARMLERALNLKERNANVHAGLARVYAWSGDFAKADRHQKLAEQKYSRSQSPWATIHPVNAKATIALNKGRYKEAIRNYRTALNTFWSTGQIDKWPEWLDANWRHLARSLARDGKLNEAELEIRDALKNMLDRYGTKYHRRIVGTMRTFSDILIRKGRLNEARQMVGEVIQINKTVGVPETALDSIGGKFMGAVIDLNLGDYVQSYEKFRDIERSVGDDPWMVEKYIKKTVDRFFAYVLGGRAQDVLPEIESLVKENAGFFGEDSAQTLVSRSLLGLTLASLGRDREALSHFRAGMSAVEDVNGGTSAGSGGGTSFSSFSRTLLLEGYLNLLARLSKDTLTLPKGFDARSEAFRIASALRSQVVDKALSASAARASVDNPELADLIRREQDAAHRAAALSTLLLNNLSSGDRSASELRQRLESLQQAREALLKEIGERFPDYAGLINPKPLSVAQARQHLRSGEALLSIYSGKKQTFVWAVPKEGQIAYAAVPLGRDELDNWVEALRTSLDPGAIASLGDIPAFDTKSAYDLFAKLLKPVEAGWKDAKSLLVITDGALGQLPFSLLPTAPVTLKPESGVLFSRYREVPWLARSHAVTVLPSVSSLKSLRGVRKGRKADRPFAGFGDPFFNRPQQLAARRAARRQVASLRSAPKLRSADNVTIENLPRLADSRDEITAIAKVMKADLSRDVFLGEKASEDTVKSLDLTSYRVISFATHGLVPGDLNGLMQPALALSAPSVTRGKEDGLLTMGEILGLKLNADWAVLSACNTAAAEGKGASAVSGLGRAFFYAGARSLLVSNWPVHSGATTELMTTLFKLQADNPRLSRAEALRRTRLHMIDKAVARLGKKIGFSYAHPIFWAPFAIVGDGGGA